MFIRRGRCDTLGTSTARRAPKERNAHGELCNSLQRTDEVISQRVTIFDGTKFGGREKRELKQYVNNP